MLLTEAFRSQRDFETMFAEQTGVGPEGGRPIQRFCDAGGVRVESRTFDQSGYLKFPGRRSLGIGGVARLEFLRLPGGLLQAGGAELPGCCAGRGGAKCGGRGERIAGEQGLEVSPVIIRTGAVGRRGQERQRNQEGGDRGKIPAEGGAAGAAGGRTHGGAGRTPRLQRRSSPIEKRAEYREWGRPDTRIAGGSGAPPRNRK